jgi:hypothetical protein
MNGIIWMAIMLALHVWPGVVAPAHGQGSRKDDIVFNSRGVPLAGATVRICAMPASGQPCTPMALIYSDPLLTQALANPTATDGMGNYSFYAAPGKYEIEISGPGITTKQLPNVILPSDPSSPTFNSLSSTGNINAFSLSLTGNLTVNGNTTVVGNFASGTLNLANQSAAPGAASSGTVNLYTKTADKRLYYKDDTGTEIGPIASGSGAQTNVPNTFTAAQNIDADFHTKGPNPSYDVTRYGGYIGPYYNTGTTGTMTGSSSVLTLANALDFANGHGILVLGAGPAPTIVAPSMVSAVPAQVVGTSTRTYAVVAEDYFGGRVPATTTATTTTAVATPGIQTATIASCNRVSGVVTCTTTGNHNFQTGAQIEIPRNSTGDGSFEGVFTLTSASGTTFTYNQYGASDANGTVTSGTARVAGRIVLKWNAQPVTNTVLRNYIYVCTTTCSLPANAANFTLEGVSTGNDSYFVDAGYPMSAINIGNGDVPTTIQTAASNQWLSTTIVNGGGGTSLTLANAASNGVNGVKVLHDNSPNIRAACAAFPNNGSTSIGGTIFVPTSLNFNYYFPINSTLNMVSCLGQTEIQFASPTWMQGTIVMRAQNKLKGLAAGNVDQATPFYNLNTQAVLVGMAYPMVYMTPGQSHDLSLENLIILANQSYQTGLYQDQDLGGDGVTSVRYEDVHLSGGAYSTPLVTKGGFGFYWTRGGWSNTPIDFAAPPAALFTTNCGPGTTNPLLPYIIYTDHTYEFGGGIVVDSCGAALVSSGGNAAMRFTDLLTEGSYVPMVRVNTASYYQFSDIEFFQMSYADTRSGSATPLIDLTNGTASGIRVIQPACATGNQPVFEVSNSTTAYFGLEVWGGGFSGGCILGANSGVSRNGSANSEVYNAYSVFLNNGSRLALQQIPPPGAPQSAVPGGTGSVPSGTTTYAFTASDYDGGETLVGPAITANPNGSQQVVVTAPTTFPAGASGVNLYRNGYLVLAGCTKPQLTTPGGTLTDSASFTCGPNQPTYNTTGITSLSANGTTSSKFRIGTEVWSASPRGEQNVFLPGALSSTWTGSSWTLDKGVTITRVQVQAKTAPAGCTTNAIVRVSDGSTPINLTIAAAGNDSGVITQNYAPGALVTVSVQTAAAGCTTTPADANVTIQYRMQ